MIRRYRFILIPTVLIWCAVFSPAQSSGSDLDQLLKHFPGYHLLTLQERDRDTRAFFARHFPKANPSLIRADFDGDGNADYAAVIRDDKSPSTKLVVLLCQANRECKTVYQLDETAYRDAVYLRPTHVGSQVSQTDAINNSTPLAKPAFTGIQVTYFEKGKVVLYWNRKLRKIEEMQTED